MSSTGTSGAAHAGGSAGNAIKKGFAKIHVRYQHLQYLGLSPWE